MFGSNGSGDPNEGKNEEVGLTGAVDTVTGANSSSNSSNGGGVSVSGNSPSDDDSTAHDTANPQSSSQIRCNGEKSRLTEQQLPQGSISEGGSREGNGDTGGGRTHSQDGDLGEPGGLREESNGQDPASAVPGGGERQGTSAAEVGAASSEESLPSPSQSPSPPPITQDLSKNWFSAENALRVYGEVGIVRGRRKFGGRARGGLGGVCTIPLFTVISCLNNVAEW